MKVRSGWANNRQQWVEFPHVKTIEEAAIEYVKIWKDVPAGTATTYTRVLQVQVEDNEGNHHNIDVTMNAQITYTIS